MATTQSDAVQLSLPLPKSLDTRIYIRLSLETRAIVLSLTTASPDEPAQTAPMGSFVYGLPNASYLNFECMLLLTFTSDSTLRSPSQRPYFPTNLPWNSQPASPS